MKRVWFSYDFGDHMFKKTFKKKLIFSYLSKTYVFKHENICYNFSCVLFNGNCS